MNLKLRATILSGIVALSLFVAGPVQAASAGGSSVVCRYAKQFDEVSGITPSLEHPGVLWLHNDSGGGPRIYAIDATTCKTLATLTIRGARARDYEAIASGRDAKGRPVLWLGDIGDNLDSWPYVEILRIREPKVLRDATVDAKAYRFTYPDRPHNAEALLADPHRPRVWVVTKQLAHGSLYEVPLQAQGVAVARKLRTEDSLITDGAVAPDGSKYVVRDYFDATIYAGLPAGRRQVRFALPAQVQGEAICWTSDGRALLVASEKDRRLIRVSLPSVVR